MADGALREGQTSDSHAARTDPAWEPDWITGRFCGMLTCAQCPAEIAIAGVYQVVDDRYWDPATGEGGDYASQFTPQYFSDPPHIVAVPPTTPEAVAKDLHLSFQLFWLDPDACANRLRSAVEGLLTIQRIPRTTGRAKLKGRRRFLSLHARIELLKAKNREMGDSLMAIKWLGNAGSHAKPITKDDLLDGYEILGYVLDQLYERRRQRVGALTRHINRRKAPRSARRGPRP